MTPHPVAERFSAAIAKKLGATHVVDFSKVNPVEEIMRITDAAVEETAAEKRARELMLHGPQFKGEGVSQDDIDAFF